MRLRGYRACRLTHLIRVLDIPAPRIRLSREGGNPRTNIPRKNANGDTSAHVHFDHPTSAFSAPKFVFPAEFGIQGAERRHVCLSNYSANQRLSFHTLVCRVCRRQPA